MPVGLHCLVLQGQQGPREVGQVGIGRRQPVQQTTVVRVDRLYSGQKGLMLEWGGGARGSEGEVDGDMNTT